MCQFFFLYHLIPPLDVEILFLINISIFIETLPAVFHGARQMRSLQAGEMCEGFCTGMFFYLMHLTLS